MYVVGAVPRQYANRLRGSRSALLSSGVAGTPPVVTALLAAHVYMEVLYLIRSALVVAVHQAQRYVLR